MSRREARLCRRMARRLPVLPGPGELAALEPWLGAPLGLRPGLPYAAPSPIHAPLLWPGALRARLHLGGGPREAWLEVEGRLALALLDRALGGEGEVGGDARDLSELELGALAYALGRLLALGEGRARLLDLEVVRERQDQEREAAAPGELGAVWPIAARLGDLEGELRVWLSEEALLRAPEAPSGPSGPSLRRLGGLPVRLVMRGGRGQLRASELRGAAPGDIVLPDQVGIAAEGGEGLRGEVEITLESGAPVLRGRLAAEGLLIEGFPEPWERPAAPRAQEAKGETMSEQDPDEAERGEGAGMAHAAAMELPIELSLELARFSLTVGELAALRPGEILRTGRDLGERVALSAGGQVFAEGELVDVEGEIGVRLLRLLGGGLPKDGRELPFPRPGTQPLSRAELPGVAPEADAVESSSADSAPSSASK